MATACDLRYLGESAATDSRDRIDDHAIVVRDLSARLNRAISEPSYLATLHDSLLAIVARLDDEASRLNDTANATYDRIDSLVEKVRADFHRAVDERVEETINDGEYVDRESMNEALSTLRRNIKDAIADAVDGADAY